jgi:hypothetical protein
VTDEERSLLVEEEEEEFVSSFSSGTRPLFLDAWLDLDKLPTLLTTTA